MSKHKISITTTITSLPTTTTTTTTIRSLLAAAPSDLEQQEVKPQRPPQQQQVGGIKDLLEKATKNVVESSDEWCIWNDWEARDKKVGLWYPIK